MATILNVTVSAASPLIIDSPALPTTYGTVTILEGGYIAITVPCQFICQKMIALVAAAPPASQATIRFVGIDGAAGGDGSSPAAPPPAAAGTPGTCKDGRPDRPGGTGERGENGVDGGNASPAGNGTDAPAVVVQIGDLSGPISTLNCGGLLAAPLVQHGTSYVVALPGLLLDVRENLSTVLAHFGVQNPDGWEVRAMFVVDEPLFATHLGDIGMEVRSLESLRLNPEI